MTTVDPLADRRARRRRQVGKPGLLIGAIVAGVFQLNFGLSLGWGIGGLVDTVLRTPSMYDALDSRFQTQVEFRSGITFIGAAIGLIAAAATTRYLLDRYRGGGKQPAVQAPATLFAVAVGLTISALSWTETVTPGTKWGLGFRADQDWGVYSWVMYYANIWLPALAFLIAVLTTLYAVRHNARLRSQVSERDRLLREGRVVDGVVTDVTVRTSQTNEGHRSVAGADVVVKFAYPQGTERWVTRYHQGRSGIPVVGAGSVSVLLDPQRPGEDALVFVAFQPEPLPGEWLGASIA